ncbi:hypothetical protein AUF72_00880 [Euryarchaeota archaeon 13_1_20CM_2_64_92]|nr:MAG: hypothetical protein AUF72_00880 [Euryarchaeota archaeon 13_1_20CM_2_64_92]
MFAHDQQERRAVLFQARHWRHCHVSDADVRTREKAYRPIPAPHDQQTPRSASFLTPQWGQSQLGPTICGSFRARIRQSAQAKTAPPTRSTRSAPDSRSSTVKKIPAPR